MDAFDYMTNKFFYRERIIEGFIIIDNDLKKASIPILEEPCEIGLVEDREINKFDDKNDKNDKKNRKVRKNATIQSNSLYKRQHSAFWAQDIQLRES